MSAPNAIQEARLQISDAIAQIRQAQSQLREGVVIAVMRRNKLQDDVVNLERLLADIDAKVGLAEKINKPDVASDLRQFRLARQAELERMRKLLAEAEAQAESAKIQMPEQEANLLRQANDLTAQMARLSGAQVEANSPEGLGTEADAMWNRASEKMRGLQREASARGEVANAAAGGGASGSAYTPAAPPISHEQSAEAMLTALENRLGLPAPSSEAGEDASAPPVETAASNAPPPRPTFLEFDSAPTGPLDPSQVPAQETPPAVPAAVATNIPVDIPVVTAADFSAGGAPVAAPNVAAAPAAAVLPAVASAPPAVASAPPAVASAPPATFENVVPIAKGVSSRMEKTDRVRVAAIGTGGIFRGAHLPAYPDIPQAQLVAFCDPDKQAQDLAYRRYQELVEAKIKRARERDDHAEVERLENDLETVQICDDISEVIETVKPDLVDICTQPFLHTPLAIQALDAGLHVMCEKPLSRSWLESERLMAAIARSGKFYQHNENWLFDPDYYTARKLVQSGAIGELVMMFLTQAHGGPEGNPKFWNPDFGGGGALLDNGIHAIGAAWFVTGLDKRPALVKAADPFGMSIRMPERILDGRFQPITVDDDAHILIRFEDEKKGAWSTAHVEGSWSHQDSPGTVFTGTTGSLHFVNDSETGKRYGVVTDAYGREARRIESSGPTWQPWPSSFFGEIQNMVECVRHGAQSIMTAQFGADCSAIVGAAYLSEKNGRKAVSLDEFKAFAHEIAGRYPNDPTGADNALVDALLAAVRK